MGQNMQGRIIPWLYHASYTRSQEWGLVVTAAYMYSNLFFILSS
jgi:hypothetical protein